METFIHENYMHSRDQNGYYMCEYKLIYIYIYVYIRKYMLD
jgi:hypothetical protein